MNAPAFLAAPVVRAIDLRDAGECARIAAFVAGQDDGTPFHLPAWSIATARGCNQTAQYLIAERGGVPTGVLPLTEVHSPLFGRALVSTGFGVDGGILGDARSAAALASEAWRLAERLSCPTLELRGGGDPGAGFATNRTSYVGFARPLACDDDAELLAIPRKQRAEVRRSLGFDLDISVGRDVAVHHAIYAESVRNLGTPVFPRSLFAATLDAFGEAADILTVRHRGRAVASVLSLYWRGTVYPYWGGGTAEARALRANDRMYFALMSHARARGCTHFDFGRSKAGTGAAVFKKNWGFDPAPRTYHTRTADGMAAREINPLDPRYRMQVRLWSKLPLAVANRVGPWISRGLG